MNFYTCVQWGGEGEEHMMELFFMQSEFGHLSEVGISVKDTILQMKTINNNSSKYPKSCSGTKA